MCFLIFKNSQILITQHRSSDLYFKNTLSGQSILPVSFSIIQSKIMCCEHYYSYYFSCLSTWETPTNCLQSTYSFFGNHIVHHFKHTIATMLKMHLLQELQLECHCMCTFLMWIEAAINSTSMFPSMYESLWY